MESYSSFIRRHSQKEKKYIYTVNTCILYIHESKSFVWIINWENQLKCDLYQDQIVKYNIRVLTC